MSGRSRLEPVLADAERRERDAAEVLSVARDKVSAQRTRIEQLRQYSAEYAADLETRGGQGMHVSQLRDYGSFLARLNEAIRAEMHALTTLEQAETAAFDGWKSAHMRMKALGKAVERALNEHMRKLARREQAAADERSSRPAPAR